MSEFKAVTDFVNFLPYKELNIVRAYRVAFPVLKLKVNISRETPAKSFHIIEKYMDQLISGYTGDSSDFGDRIYIDSKQQLFELMGIDGEAYDISSLFYNDLLANGHFEETGEGLKTLGVGKDSIKLQKKLITSNDSTIVTVDPFTMTVLSDAFPSTQMYTAERVFGDYDKHVLFLDPPAYISDATAVENALNSVKYDAIGLADRKLPQDFKSFTVSETDGKSFCDVRYLVFFLTVAMENGEKRYTLYDIESATPVAEFDVNSDNYGSLRETIDAISGREVENKGFGHNVSSNFFVKIKHKYGICNGIAVTENGNYVATITDKMLYDMVYPEKDGFSLKPFHYMINDSAVVLDYFESGRLLTFSFTEEQLEFAKQIVGNNPEFAPIAEEYFKNKSISSEQQTAEDDSDDKEVLKDENSDETEKVTSDTLKPGTEKQKVLVKPKKRIRHYDDDDFFSRDDEDYDFNDDWEDYSRYDDEWDDGWEDFAKEREREEQLAEKQERLEKQIARIKSRIRGLETTLLVSDSRTADEIKDIIRQEEYELHMLVQELKYLR